MKMLSLAVVAMGALALPFGAQALSVSVVFDASREADLNWSEHVQAGLALSLGSVGDIQVLDPVGYSGPDDFAGLVSDLATDVVIINFPQASTVLSDEASRPLLMNLSPAMTNTCDKSTLHLAGDVALGRLAALYMNDLNAQRTFAFVKENEEGQQNLADFRRAFTGGLGGAAFAEPDQSNFDNEIAILRVTKADGAYFDLEGDALYRYLDAFAQGVVSDTLNTVTTSEIDYDRLPEDTRAALSSMTLVSAWNPDTVDAAEFKAAFNAQLGEDPSFAGLMGFEAGDLLLKAMKGTEDTLFDNVVSLSWQSPRGPVSFDAYGYAIVPVGAYGFTDTALSLKGRISVQTNHGCSES